VLTNPITDAKPPSRAVSLRDESVHEPQAAFVLPECFVTEGMGHVPSMASNGQLHASGSEPISLGATCRVEGPGGSGTHFSTSKPQQSGEGDKKEIW